MKREAGMAIKHVLVVDDSKSARMVLRRMLQEAQLKVDTAESAEAALDFLAKVRPDAIFMDQTMPGMDGLDAVSMLKSNLHTAAIPVAMYTSREGDEFAGQARARGAVGLLPKPATRENLSEVLNQLNDAADAALKSPPKVVQLKRAAAGATGALASQDASAADETLRGVIGTFVEQALDAHLGPALDQRITEMRAGLDSSVRAGVMELVTSLCDSRLNTLSSRLDLKVSAQLADLRENFTVSGNLDNGLQDEIRELARSVAEQSAADVSADRAREVAREVAAKVVESSVELLTIRLEQQLQARLDRVRAVLERPRKASPEMIAEVRETARLVALQHAQRIATETTARALAVPTESTSGSGRISGWFWPALVGGVTGALVALALVTMT